MNSRIVNRPVSRPAERTASAAQYQGQTLSWGLRDGVIELALHREPLNEISSLTLEELEKFTAALQTLSGDAHAIILYSSLKSGFCAGADLRELYQWILQYGRMEVAMHARAYLERIHHVMNVIDASPLTSIAAVHGVTFGGGFELALVCDIMIADKMARFCFPELRLGLIPGYGGIPRLKRDLGNAVVRDLLLTGRSFNATKAQQTGLVSQVVGEGEALRAARATAAQMVKFDRTTAAVAKRFIKPIPHDELRQEIDLFCELISRPAVELALKKFVESTDAQPYLP
ncbi:MAG TPA: enoyl-CoA hydratase/isomerase family protein [Candidatus Sulfotelmatobacter sp.]